VPRRHIVLDSEAYCIDGPGGQVQTFRLAVACFDHQDRKGTPHQPPEWDAFFDTSRIWEWVTARTRKGRRTVLWAHNLAYDLRITRAFVHLPMLGWEIDAVRLDRGSAYVQWRKDGATLAMCDSVSWFGASLEVVGKLVGIGKLDLPAEDDTQDAWLRRCRRDVEILRAAVRKALGWIEDDDMGNWKPTGAGQGWAAFRHKWMTHRILHHDVDAVAAHEREAAWTGRCEAWRHGDLGLGPWHELDFTAAYAHVARDVSVPTRLMGRLSPSEAKRFLRGVEGRSALLLVEVTTEAPVVPTRGEKGVLWPVGTFQSWLWDVEAVEVLREGGHLKILQAWQYRSAPALQAWAEWVLARLDDPSTVFDPVLRLIVKNWSRSVIGRFGSRYTDWESFGEAHGPDVTLSTMSDGDTGEVTRTLTLGPEMYVESAPRDAPDGAVHVMSYVMAVTRCRLLTAMRVAGLDNIAYVDTDGLLVNDAGAANLASTPLPGLRSKATWSHVEILGPRQLVLDGKLRAAGIPSRAVRTGPQTWSGEIWRSLGGSLAQGQTDRVVVQDREWTLQGTDNRRLHLPGGVTAAIRL
jgi:hypothetical protein